jgi:hypothetical protein
MAKASISVNLSSFRPLGIVRLPSQHRFQMGRYWGKERTKGGNYEGVLRAKKANLGVISVICRNPADFVAASLTVATKK